MSSSSASQVFVVVAGYAPTQGGPALSANCTASPYVVNAIPVPYSFPTSNDTTTASAAANATASCSASPFSCISFPSEVSQLQEGTNCYVGPFSSLPTITSQLSSLLMAGGSKPYIQVGYYSDSQCNSLVAASYMQANSCFQATSSVYQQITFSGNTLSFSAGTTSCSPPANATSSNFLYTGTAQLSSCTSITPFETGSTAFLPIASAAGPISGANYVSISILNASAKSGSLKSTLAMGGSLGSLAAALLAFFF